MQFVLQEPLLVHRLLKNYFKLVVLKKNVLRSVEVDLGFDCQLNCKHCYAQKMKNSQRKELTFIELKDIVDQCVQLGTVYFFISGGEPLLYKEKLLQLVKYIKNTHTYAALVTNGQKLEKRLLEQLKIAGLDLIMVSIDSHNKKVHDNNRNKKGCYRKAIDGIRLAKKMGFKVFTSTVLTQEKINRNEIANIIRINKKIGVESHFCFPVPIGNWNNKENVILNKSYWDMIKKSFKKNDIRMCEEGNYIKKGCSAGIEKIAITCYGDVMPCPYIQITFGNLKDKKLKDILKIMNKNKYFKDMNEFCLPASNKKFIKEYINGIRKCKKLPLIIKRKS
ncbi:MAG: radical SAM protein [Nanoarchaeota archaeon]